MITSRQACGVLGSALVVMAATVGFAAAPPAPEKFVGEVSDIRGGGDIRIRQVHFDDIPISVGGVTRGGENHFFRFRTRLWEEFDFGDCVTVRTRLVNEFRDYQKPQGSPAWEAPDETIVDTLYLDVKDLMGGALDVRVGRQDLIYGTGKVILEGTPKDGSRTIYMDAAKLSWTGIEGTTIDVFGIYNRPENKLAFSSEERDLTGLAPGFNDMIESGGGVYLMNKVMPEMPWEAYYVYKNEEEWQRTPGDVTTTIDELDLNTVGFRVMPKFCEEIHGNMEVAYQFGERGDTDVDGMMVDALLNWHVPGMERLMPCLGAGVYYLSGDDPDSADEEGWNPLWARWPQYSELYIYAFDADGAGRWSNVLMPHADLTMKPSDRMKARAMVGYMTAPEEDGPGTGDERGILGTLRIDFTLAQQLLTKKDKLFGHVVAEVLDPGDYYEVDDTAHFLRWELSYSF